MSKHVMREGSELIYITAYAPGDGDLSFVARYTEDNPAGRRSEAAYPGPTKEECLKACPEGWDLYLESPYWRARKRPTTSLYEDIVAAGIEVSNWQSDLYFEVTDESRRILAKHPLQEGNATRFRNNVTGKASYDVPFAYDPYWATRRRD